MTQAKAFYFVGKEEQRLTDLQVRLVGLYVKSDAKDRYPDTHIFYLETKGGRKLKWQAASAGMPDAIKERGIVTVQDLRDYLEDLRKAKKYCILHCAATVTEHQTFTNKHDLESHITHVQRLKTTGEIRDQFDENPVIFAKEKFTLAEYKVQTVLNHQNKYQYHLMSRENVLCILNNFGAIEKLVPETIIRLPHQWAVGNEIIGYHTNVIYPLSGFTDLDEALLTLSNVNKRVSKAKK
jgi:hypothetical protein